MKSEQTELKEANTLLVNKNTELDDFAYTVSHDLKNPINIIKGFLNLIKDDPGLFEGYFNRIINQCDFMLSFISNLLQLSRAGKIIDQEKEINLENLIKMIVVVSKPPELKLNLKFNSSNTGD